MKFGTDVGEGAHGYIGLSLAGESSKTSVYILERI